MSKHLIIIGTVVECERDEYFEAWEKVTELKALLRESLNQTGDKRWHDKVWAALGEPKPPMRKLKAKVPRYQRAQGFDENGPSAQGEVGRILDRD